MLVILRFQTPNLRFCDDWPVLVSITVVEHNVERGFLLYILKLKICISFVVFCHVKKAWRAPKLRIKTLGLNTILTVFRLMIVQIIFIFIRRLLHTMNDAIGYKLRWQWFHSRVTLSSSYGTWSHIAKILVPSIKLSMKIDEVKMKTNENVIIVFLYSYFMICIWC